MLYNTGYFMLYNASCYNTSYVMLYSTLYVVIEQMIVMLGLYNTSYVIQHIIC